ncbi:MAG: hypothetical protein JWM03_1704 [Rhodocyclales bacterium]|nr:hypothetical protein [Rhodocyclales bacterium]
MNPLCQIWFGENRFAGKTSRTVLDVCLTAVNRYAIIVAAKAASNRFAIVINYASNSRFLSELFERYRPVFDLDILDTRTGRPKTRPVDHRRHCRVCSANHRLDTAIATIAHPAAHTQPSRLLRHAPAKTNALHLTTDQQMAAHPVIGLYLVCTHSGRFRQCINDGLSAQHGPVAIRQDIGFANPRHKSRAPQQRVRLLAQSAQHERRALTCQGAPQAG